MAFACPPILPDCETPGFWILLFGGGPRAGWEALLLLLLPPQPSQPSPGDTAEEPWPELEVSVALGGIMEDDDDAIGSVVVGPAGPEYGAATEADDDEDIEEEERAPLLPLLSTLLSRSHATFCRICVWPQPVWERTRGSRSVRLSRFCKATSAVGGWWTRWWPWWC